MSLFWIYQPAGLALHDWTIAASDLEASNRRLARERRARPLSDDLEFGPGAKVVAAFISEQMPSIRR